MADSNNNKTFRSGHRNRLRQKLLTGHLTDTERLELLIADVVPRCDVYDLARELIKRFGGISQVLCAPIEDLESVRGVGHIVATHFKLVQEIMLAGYKRCMAETKLFYDEKVLHNYCLTLLSGKSVEEMHVLYLDQDYKMLVDDVNSIGTVDWTPVFERDIVKRALNLNARHIVMVHNHPACKEAFSTEDIESTEIIKQLLAPFGINLYDHYVVANGIIYSFRDFAARHLIK